MLNLFILATEAAEEGFGINFDILETNLINLAILVGVLVYFGSKSLGQILAERREKIAEAIREAEERKTKAQKALAEQEQKLAQAQAEAQRIIKAAEERAVSAQVAIAKQTEQDIQRMRETAAQDLSAEQDKVIAELKQRIAALAIDRVEAQLKSTLDESAQQKLIDRSLAQLGGR